MVIHWRSQTSDMVVTRVYIAIRGRGWHAARSCHSVLLCPSNCPNDCRGESTEARRQQEARQDSIARQKHPPTNTLIMTTIRSGHGFIWQNIFFYVAYIARRSILLPVVGLRRNVNTTNIPISMQTNNANHIGFHLVVETIRIIGTCGSICHNTAKPHKKNSYR